MPVVAPIMKIQNCKNYGATVIIHGQNIGESRQAAFFSYYLLSMEIQEALLIGITPSSLGSRRG